MDIFEALLSRRHGHKSKHGGFHDKDSGYQESRYQNRHARDDEHGSYQRSRHAFEPGHPMLRNLPGNKIAILALALLALITCVVLVAAIAYMLPLVPKVLGPIQEHGVKNLLDQGIQILSTLWLGAGK